ncbi:MAG: methionine aminotransferase [Bacteroidota bacterium]
MSKVTVESKLPYIGTSIFTVMTALARQHGALNLAQGFPDFPADPKLLELVHQAMRDGHNQYAPAPGIMALREAISNLAVACYSAEYNPDTEVTVTSGATEALYCAITSTIREGDEVIVFEPAYDSYVPVIELCGGIPVYISLEFPEYKINWEMVKKQVNSRTRMIILNSPHNPSGAILSSQDMKELAKIVQANPIVILSDEVYEHIIFDGLEHQSIARYPELAERSFIVSSFGKTFHTTGWKTGYCLAPEYMMREFRKVHQFITFSTSHPFQVALAAYMKDPTRITELASFYQKKRDFFQSVIRESRFKALNCSGTYFQLLDYSAISDEKDVDFAKRMTEEFKLAAIPVSVFYHGGEDNKVLRFCFAKELETMDRAAEIMLKM